MASLMTGKRYCERGGRVCGDGVRHCGDGTGYCGRVPGSRGDGNTEKIQTGQGFAILKLFKLLETDINVHAPIAIRPGRRKSIGAGLIFSSRRSLRPQPSGRWCCLAFVPHR